MMEKRLLALLLVLAMALSLAACKAREPDAVAIPSGLIETYEEYAPMDMALSSVTFDSFDTICQYSNAIVKGTYLGYEPFDHYMSAYAFLVEEDYTGLCGEDIIYIYENPKASYITGKTYYLCLWGLRMSLYPHVKYSRVNMGFLAGEAEDGSYTFYNGVTKGADSLGDLDAYIRDEIVAKGRYYTDSRGYAHEELRDAYENADVVTLVTVTTLSPWNPAISHSHFVIERDLKGKYFEKPVDTTGLSYEVLDAAGLLDYDPEKETPGMTNMVPPDTQPGDQFVLLLRYNEDEGYLSMYSTENFSFRADSEEGKLLIELSEKGG